MKNLKSYLAVLLTVFSAALLLISCDPVGNPTPQSAIFISLTDAPGDYQAVNIEVLDVLIKNTLDTTAQGWTSVADKNLVGPGKIFNLLSLTGGAVALMVDTYVPSGNLGQIRLVLGTQNTVMVGNVTYPLDTPSNQQSGLTLNVGQTLSPNTIYNYLLDFNVDKSIVSTGSGKYSLVPSIRFCSSANSGAINGTITQTVAYQVTASVTVGTDVISTYANAQGVFQLNGVPAGTYAVTLTPAPASGVAPKTIPGVIVVNGQITPMGNITLP